MNIYTLLCIYIYIYIYTHIQPRLLEAPVNGSDGENFTTASEGDIQDEATRFLIDIIHICVYIYIYITCYTDVLHM